MMTQAYFKGNATQVKHCPVRGACPLGSLCGRSRVEGTAPLYPTFEEVARGETVWTDLRYEQRVRIVRQGIFALVPNFDYEGSVVTSLFGSGYSIGLAELYIPRTVAGTYHLIALAEGRLCSFPAKALKRHLEGLPSTESNAIISCAFTNLVEASCTQARTVSKTSLYERIVLLLARLRELRAQQGVEMTEVKLTHEEIAVLAASDRASVTRALHKLKQDGLIELGYKTIRFTDALVDAANSCLDVHVSFQCPKSA